MKKVKRTVLKSPLSYPVSGILLLSNKTGAARRRAAGTGGNTMSEYEIRSVGGHVEVYTRGGVFLFSADTVREAMEELDEAA